MDAQQARQLDPWFWSHYETAAGIVVSLVPAGFARRIDEPAPANCPNLPNG